jgi:alkenylglycerophosphocholine hydrolase
MDIFKSFSLKNKIAITVFFASFIAYMATLQYRPYPFSYVVKIIPILSLALFALINIEHKKRIFIVAALLFSAVGDVILAMDGSGLFIYGLGSFAIAHCLYIVTFFEHPEWNRGKSFFIYLFIFYGLSVAYIFIPRLGNMIIPVLVYMILITFMGISAAAGRKNHYIIIAGAVLFMISDSLIAVNMFLVKIPHSSYWIMATYFPAQFLITLGTYINHKSSSAARL